MRILHRVLNPTLRNSECKVFMILSWAISLRFHVSYRKATPISHSVSQTQHRLFTRYSPVQQINPSHLQYQLSTISSVHFQDPEGTDPFPLLDTMQACSLGQEMDKTYHHQSRNVLRNLTLNWSEHTAIVQKLNAGHWARWRYYAKTGGTAV